MTISKASKGWRGWLLSGLAAMGLALCPTTALAAESNIGEDLGLGVASALCSVLYAPVKIVYAAGGLLVGGMGWALSGGDGDVAKAIIDPAVRGDYVVTPAILKGERPLEIYGNPPPDIASQDSAAAAPDW